MDDKYIAAPERMSTTFDEVWPNEPKSMPGHDV